MCKTKHPIEIALKDLNSNISVGSVINDHGICSNHKWLLYPTIIIKTDSIKKAVEKLIGD